MLALAAAASVCSAQSSYFTQSSEFFSDGAAETIDVVLDATGFGGDFFAWRSFEFEVLMGTTGTAFDPADFDVAESSAASAGSDTTGDGANNFGPFGAAWTSGRRPGAFPGANDLAGGMRSDGYRSLVTSRRLATFDGPITGMQASVDGDNNFNINRDRVIEVFRFEFVYRSAYGQVAFVPWGLRATYYTGPDTDEFAEMDLLNVTGLVSLGWRGPLPPAPGTLPALGVAGVVASRRRRG